MFLSSIQQLDKTFSIRLSSDHFSWIDIGEPNESIVGEYADKDLAMETYDDFFWSMGMKGIRINGGKPWGFGPNE